jgi:hypothetical protein
MRKVGVVKGVVFLCTAFLNITTIAAEIVQSQLELLVSIPEVR